MSPHDDLLGECVGAFSQQHAPARLALKNGHGMKRKGRSFSHTSCAGKRRTGYLHCNQRSGRTSMAYWSASLLDTRHVPVFIAWDTDNNQRRNHTMYCSWQAAEARWSRAIGAVACLSTHLLGGSAP